MSLKHPGSKYHDTIKGRSWELTRWRAFARDGWKCCECGKHGQLHAHHILELEHGGTNDLINLQTLCRACHIEHHQKESNPDRWNWRRFTHQLVGDHTP